MASSFEKRRDGFESKFAHDEELRFKATSRRNRLFGAWAAEKLGRSGSEADAYAAEVVKSDFEEAGDEDVIRKVRGDFEAAGVHVSDDEIRQALNGFLAEAVRQIEAGA